MPKSTYKIIIIVFFVFSQNFIFAQNNVFEFNKIDTLIKKNNFDLALYKLNDYTEIAKKNNDTLTLIDIYDYYIKIFEKDSLNNNEKKFILKKIILIKKHLKNSPQNTHLINELLKTYYKLSDLYILRKEYYTVLDIYLRMLPFAKRTTKKNDEAQIYSHIGLIYQKINDLKTAIYNFKKSTKIARKCGDSLIVFNNYMYIGDLYFETGHFSKAIYEYYEGLTIAKLSKSNKNEVIAYTRLGNTFFALELYKKAIEYTNNALKIYNNNDKIINQKLLLKKHTFLGKNYLKLDSTDLAIKHLNNALFIAQKLNNKKEIAKIYCLLGETHTKSEDYVLATDYLTKSFLIRKKIGDTSCIIKSDLAFGKLYLKLNNYSKAKYHLIDAYKKSKKLNKFNYIKESSFLLSKIFSSEQNYEKAYYYFKDHKKASDSMIKKTNFLSIERIEAQQKNRLSKEKMQSKLDYTKKSKKTLTILIIFLTVLVASLIILIIFFVYKNKEAKRNRNLVEKQKQIILKQYERYKLLSLVASHTDNSIFIVDDNWKIIWVNNSLLKLYKTTHYNIFTKSNADFKKLSQGDIDEIKESCVIKQKSISYTTLVEIKNEKKWIQTTISPIIEDEKVVNLIGIETDITTLKIAQLEIQNQKKDIEYKNKLMEIYNQELKQQKEAITAQNEELRQQQEELQAHADLLEEYNKELQRLSVVASETDNIVYIFDIQGNLSWVNNAFTKHTGYTLDEFIELYGANILEASSTKNISYYFYIAVEQKKSVKYVSKLKTKFGNDIWVQTTLTPLKNKKGQIIEVIAIDADITDIKKAEKKITEQNIEIKSSLEYAGRIQKSVLPMPIFLKAVFEKYFIFNKPRDIVSGDFYFLHYNTDKSILAVADSTGHGIPGAFMSLVGTMALKIVLTDLNTFNLNTILKRLNNEIIKFLHQRGDTKGTFDSIDMALCSFDFNNNTLDYSGANIPLYLSRKDKNDKYKISRIKPTKATIGYDTLKENFTIHSFNIEKGDTIYLASDGFPDQFGGDENKKLKRKGFMQLLENTSKLKIEDQEEALSNFLKKWIKSNDQIDDILVVGIKY